MFKFNFALLLSFVLLSAFNENIQTTENNIKVSIPTKFGIFLINKEEIVTVKSSFDNKKQSVTNYKEISSKTYVLTNQLKISDKVKKDLADYKSYDEDLYVVLTLNKVGNVTKYTFLQESVLPSFNEFYKQLLSEVLKKMTPNQTKQLIDLKQENTIKIKLTYTK